MVEDAPAPEAKAPAAKAADLSSLSSMLQSRWKSGASPTNAFKPDASSTGQIRSFRISKLDPATKKIELSWPGNKWRFSVEKGEPASVANPLI